MPLLGLTVIAAAINVSMADSRDQRIRPPRPVTPKAPSGKVYNRYQAPKYTPSEEKSQSHHFPWKLQIAATLFWIGERPTKNNPTPNHASSWDTLWQRNYGGYDDPNPHNRTGYRPKGFTPMQNPFYVALPYNDIEAVGKTKVEARRVIPWFRERFKKQGRTVCKGQWVVIRYKNRFCFAQWEDCGPFTTDDWRYVFGNFKPKNKSNNGAGIDVSPAVRDYLKLKSGQKVDWRFVSEGEIRNGPWKYYGRNNQFAKSRYTEQAKKATAEELFQQRQNWLREGR